VRCSFVNFLCSQMRSLQVTARGGKGIAVYCDHSDPKDIENLFEQIKKEQNGRLDILVEIIKLFSPFKLLLRFR
jgi:NAD(P)-dependent dehydrogenase (short-subunit alcohol dehydrogenase family)